MKKHKSPQTSNYGEVRKKLWFWKRNNLKDSKAPNDIWTLKVRKEQVYFYTNERKEEEVVLDPYYILYVTKEREKPIKLSEKEIEKIISAL